MIELAPNHKTGLTLTNPVMIASGCCGFGQVYERLIELSVLGAVVTQSVTLRPRRGRLQPRLVETRAGFVLAVGHQNPGVKKVIKQYGQRWSRSDVPIIVHLPADEPDDLRRTARALFSALTRQGQTALSGIELGLPHGAVPQDVEDWVWAIREGSELPLLVKLPLGGTARDLAEAAANSYADALVVGTPPLATAMLPDQGQPVTGLLYGPALHSLALHDLQTLTDLDLPLVAAGGIHTRADAQTFFEMGATAVQLDSLLFIDPRAAHDIAWAFQSS
jgi:dihydroorotate dehydrogenase (NAD+) catalytic subunit